VIRANNEKINDLSSASSGADGTYFRKQLLRNETNDICFHHPAGGTNIFIPKSLVLKYLGSGTNKILSYTVATVTGTLISV
jgi:hypothetical protein